MSLDPYDSNFADVLSRPKNCLIDRNTFSNRNSQIGIKLLHVWDYEVIGNNNGKRNEFKYNDRFQVINRRKTGLEESSKRRSTRENATSIERFSNTKYHVKKSFQVIQETSFPLKELHFEDRLDKAVIDP